jgi:hypothetical protein
VPAEEGIGRPRIAFRVPLTILGAHPWDQGVRARESSTKEADGRVVAVRADATLRSRVDAADTATCPSLPNPRESVSRSPVRGERRTRLSNHPATSRAELVRRAIDLLLKRLKRV